jgi:hypothetical protein
LQKKEEEEDQLLQEIILHDMEDDEEDPKDIYVLEEEHVDMHEVVLLPMHITIPKLEEFDEEENFWDELESFSLSMDINPSIPS